MRATINLQLTYDEALKLAKYLPTEALYDFDSDKELIAMRYELCKILAISTYDL
jgi:hypothetical protein